MITLTKINKTISDLEKTDRPEDTRQYNALQKKIIFMREIKRIIETGKDEEYFKRELATLNARREKVESGFFDWHSKQPNDGRQRSEYESEYNRIFEKKKIKNQIKVITFILDK